MAIERVALDFVAELLDVFPEPACGVASAFDDRERGDDEVLPEAVPSLRQSHFLARFSTGKAPSPKGPFSGSVANCSIVSLQYYQIL